MEVNFKNNKINENNNKNHIPINIMNNIPKVQSKKDIKKKQINKRATNYFNINNNNIGQSNSKTISNHDFISSNISNYISINKSYLLEAYEKSLLILFDALKLYLKNDLQFFNNLKENFIKNVQTFYQKTKNKISIIIPNSTKTKSKISFHQKNNSHNNINNNNNQSSNKSGISNNSLNNRLNTSKQKSLKNLKKSNIDILYNKKRNSITHKKSLYTLMKESNKALMINNQIKNIIKKDCSLTLLKNYFEFNKNLKYKRTRTDKNILSNKTSKNMTKRQKINNNITNINNNIYYNQIINRTNKGNEIGEKLKDDNNLIECIKNSLDDNLKNMFDFSYQSFLNKESEREG